MYKTIVFLAVVAVQIFTVDACSLNASPTQVGDRHYYIVTSFKANWYRSYDCCRYNGMHLVTLPTVDDETKLNTVLYKLGLQDNHFWTSANDFAEYKKFVWGGNGRPVGSDLWLPTEPNNFGNLGEHCAELNKGGGSQMKLNDEQCTVQYYFICEPVDDSPAN